jgi:hypothetical protein
MPLLVLLIAAACDGRSVGPGGLPIDSRVVSTTDFGRACPHFEIIPPLSGMIRIDLTDRERAWLVESAGRRLSLRWPAGFAIAVSESPSIVDRRGRRVARDGSFLVFRQMGFGDASGMQDDPYVLIGQIGMDCYAPVTRLDR